MADHTMALLQHQTKLYMVDAHELSKDLFYQQALRNFEHFDSLSLSTPVQVEELAMMALDLEEAAGRWEPSEETSKRDTAVLLAGLLQDKADLLRDCVSIDIDEKGLPILLESYVPDLGALPSLIMSLGRDVEWEDEKDCFETLAQVLAEFFAVQAPLVDQPPAGGAGTGVEANGLTVGAQAQLAEGPKTEGVDAALEPLVVSPADSEKERGEGGEGGSGMGEGRGEESTAEGAPVGVGVGGRAELEQEAGRQPPQESATIQPPDSATTQLQEEDDELECPASPMVEGEQDESGTTQVVAAGVKAEATRGWSVKHVVFPAFKSLLCPSRVRATDGTCVQVAALEKLYRIFERC
eukprot:gene32310-16879_t